MGETSNSKFFPCRHAAFPPFPGERNTRRHKVNHCLAPPRNAPTGAHTSPLRVRISPARWTWRSDPSVALALTSPRSERHSPCRPRPARVALPVPGTLPDFEQQFPPQRSRQLAGWQRVTGDSPTAAAGLWPRAGARGSPRPGWAQEALEAFFCDNSYFFPAVGFCAPWPRTSLASRLCRPMVMWLKDGRWLCFGQRAHAFQPTQRTPLS